MQTSGSKIMPKVPKYVADQPANAAIISKMIREEKKQDRSALSNNLNIPEIAMSVQDRLANNENIMQLFPDVELSIQILVSSILSPNEILSSTLQYYPPDIKMPPDIKKVLTDTIRKHMNKFYNVEDNLGAILKEALFTKGAYVEAIIPEASLDDIVNQTDGQVSVESFIDKALLKESPHAFLGVTNAIAQTTFFDSLSNESLSYGITDSTKLKDNVNRLQVSIDDLYIDITDNPTALSANTIVSNKLLSNVHDMMYKDIAVSAEAKDSGIDLDSLFKNMGGMKSVDVVEVTTMNDASRQSIGRPLVIKLPTESVIPVHAVNDPTKHIGYFVLLDSRGRPVDATSSIPGNTNDMFNNMNQSNDNKLNIINKAKTALMGITKKDPTINDIESIYSNLVEHAIKSRLKNGMYGDLVDIKDNADVYRTMFLRALRAQKTRLLFLPTELVAYYAFEYRENGTGKSLLEKVSMLFSIRSILLFSKIMASVKNSVTTTNVKATLDENDHDPQGSMEKVISEAMKTRLTQLPIGVTKIDDLVDWAHKVGFAFNFKHPGLPDMEIEVSDSATQKIIPDNELSETIENFIIMSFGLTPEIVQAGYTSDFATTVIAKNLLFAKRVTQTQIKFNPQITEHIRKISLNDKTLQDKLTELVRNNLTEIKAVLKRDKASSIEDDTDLSKIKDDDLIKYVVYSYCDGMSVELPSPELSETNNMRATFEGYRDMVNDYLELVLSEEALPTDLVGELSGKLPIMKSIMKNVLIRKWMNDNNFLPEISEFMTTGDDGKPVFNMLDDYNAYISNISDVMLGFLKTNSKYISKLDDKLSKITGNDTESSSYDDNGETDTGTDDQNNTDETDVGVGENPDDLGDDGLEPDATGGGTEEKTEGTETDSGGLSGDVTEDDLGSDDLKE